MDKPIPFKFIEQFFADDPSNISRGKLYVDSDKIREFTYFDGQCQAIVDVSYQEVDSKRHSVRFTFNRSEKFNN